MSRQIFQYDARLGYRYIPGLKARIPHEGGGYLVRCNAAGFRCGHEFVAERPPGNFRLLLFGNSYTAGDGVSDRDRYGDVLERLLPGVQVFNFGLSGTGTDQHYLAFREVAAAIEHDLVVIALMVENIRRVLSRYRLVHSHTGEALVLPKPYFELGPDGELCARHLPVPAGDASLAALPPTEREYVDVGGYHPALDDAIRRLGPAALDRSHWLEWPQPLPAYDSPGDPAWRLLRAILLRWAAESTRPVLLVLLPLYRHIEGTASAAAYQARFAELVADAAPCGLRLHDPLADFLAVPVAGRRALRFTHDIHPTVAWHAVMARSLARALRPLAGALRPLVDGGRPA